MRRCRWLAAAAALAVVLAACGSDSAENGTSTAAATTIRLADTALGRVIADADGHTLYVFTKDTPGKSACEGTCATTWPPLPQPPGAATAGAGLDAPKLGTITRGDGSAQVTYAGAPLYRYSKDTAAGDVTGQDVGGVWFVLGADGKAITASAPATTGSSAPKPTY